MLTKFLSRYRDGYELDGRVWIPGRSARLLSIPSSQFAAHPASYKMGIGGPFPGSKAAGIPLNPPSSQLPGADTTVQLVADVPSGPSLYSVFHYANLKKQQGHEADHSQSV
jgi:hypothetical protein